MLYLYPRSINAVSSTIMSIILVQYEDAGPVKVFRYYRVNVIYPPILTDILCHGKILP